MEDCKNCGGEGLIHQGESIKFTCASCSGTGKSSEPVMVAEEISPAEVQPEPVVVEEVVPEEESFLEAASEGSEVSSPEAEEIV